MGKHAKPGSGGILASVLPYSKAITGAVVAGVLMWLKVRGHGIDGDEWGQLVGAVAAGAGLVYGVPNKDPKAQHQDESTQPPDRKPGAAGRAAVKRAKSTSTSTNGGSDVMYVTWNDEPWQRR